MKKKIVNQFIITLLMLSVSLFASAQKNFVILHTNDTHSRIEPLPESDNSFPDRGGVERRANFIKQVRDENKHVLLFDAGDFLQGTPYFNMFKGKVEVETMNLMGYNAVTLGNHEFDYGMDILEKVVDKADFPIISSNYDFSGTSLDGKIKPYIIINKGGVRIGVIGININPKGLIATSNYEGVKYNDPVETANKISETLKTKHKCDIVICLSHLGYQNDIKLAESSRNIDLIIGGHSHTYLKSPTVIQNIDNKDVSVFQTAGRGVFVGRLDIKFKKATKN